MCLPDEVVINKIKTTIDVYNSEKLQSPRKLSVGEIKSINKDVMRSLSELLLELKHVNDAILKKRELIYELQEEEEETEKHSRTVQDYADDFFYAVRDSFSEKYDQHEKVRFIQLVGYIGSFLISKQLL